VSADILAQLHGHFAEDHLSRDGLWIRVNLRHLPALSSGWKLHLSATPSNVDALLARALPLLAAADLAFKTIASPDALEELNEGRHGLYQVGKAVTIYPHDEEQAARLAATLADALEGLGGPSIPSDLRFRVGAPVFFRFGPFDGRFTIDALGHARRLCHRPDLGRDVLDITSGGTEPPPQSRHFPNTPPADHLAFLRARFELLELLQLTAKGAVLVARDNLTDTRLVIKTARPGANSDAAGRDAVWALRREHALLDELRNCPGLPAPGELIEGPEATALARPHIAGHTWWTAWCAPGARGVLGQQRLRGALDQITATLDALHARGIVVRDVAPGNILIADDRAYLLDLELAHRVDDPAPPYRRGTLGFYAPQRQREAPPTCDDDAFALAALHEMLDVGLPQPACAMTRHLGTPPIPVEALYRRVLDTCATAHLAAATPGAAPDAWNVYSGLAGLLLCAAEFNDTATLTRIADSRDMVAGLEDAARQLAHIPGLYFGAPGIALALVATAHSLGRAELLDTAASILAHTDITSSQVPDLCQGVAGALTVCATASEHTGDTRFAAQAERARVQLAALARRKESALHWPWPEGDFGDLSGVASLGFAHGVAGIVYALLRHDQATGTAPPQDDLIRGGLRALETAARPIPGVPLAMHWPLHPESSESWNAWCHGGPGIAKALCAAQISNLAADLRPLTRAALLGALFTHVGGLTLCHGLASRVELGGIALELAFDADLAGWIDAAVQDDQARLACALQRWLDAPALFGAADEAPHGLMTGALGAALALGRVESSGLEGLRWLP